MAVSLIGPNYRISGPYAGGSEPVSRQFFTDDDEDGSPRRSLSGRREEILARRSDYRNYHARRLTQHTTDETYFTLTYPVPNPDPGKEPLRAPTGYQIVQELINHVIAENPVIAVLPRNQDDSAQKQSGKLTAWANGFAAHIDITKLLRKMLTWDCVRGCHVLRLLYDKGRWPPRPLRPVEPAEPDDVMTSAASLNAYMDDLVDYQDALERYEERIQSWKDLTEENLPILVDVLDPKYVLWEPGDDPHRFIVVWPGRTVDDIMNRYPETEEYLGKYPAGTKVTWCEYWDDEEYAYWIEGENGGGVTSAAPCWVQDPTRHKFGFAPFIVDGPWANPLPEADRQFPSIYFAIRSLLAYESEMLTRQRSIFNKAGWPALLIKTQNAHNDKLKPILDLTPGRQNYLAEDEDAHYLELGSATMGLLGQIIQEMDEYIQVGTGIGDVLRGTPKGKSGYQQAQIAAMAKVALVPVEQCTARTLETTIKRVFQLIKRFGERITVIGPESNRDSETPVGPKDVLGHGRIKVTLKTVLPIDEGAKIANYVNMSKAGWLSQTTAARLAGVENPEAEHEAWLAEEYSKQPFIAEAEALLFIREHRPELWAIILEHNLITPPTPPGGGPGGPPQGNPNAPRPPAGPGSAREASQVRRQGKQGGKVPKRLAQSQAEEALLSDINTGG